MRISTVVLALVVPPAVALQIAIEVAIVLVLLPFEVLEELHLQRRR